MTDVEHIEDKLCHVELSTDWYFPDNDYTDMLILFKDGPLEGNTYKIEVLKKDLEGGE